MSVYRRSGKRGYRTEGEALAELAAAQGRAAVDAAAGVFRRRERRAYLCTRWCGSWHLTSLARAA